VSCRRQLFNSLSHILPGGTGVNAAYCVAMLSCVWVKVGRKDQKNSIMDGTCTATILQITQLTVQQFLADQEITFMPHPPYSSDLTPCNFQLSPRIKIGLRGPHFVTVDKFSMPASLCTISKEVLLKCCQAQQNLEQVCVCQHAHARACMHTCKRDVLQG
jgi:hypothetical protein